MDGIGKAVGGREGGLAARSFFGPIVSEELSWACWAVGCDWLHVHAKAYEVEPRLYELTVAKELL